MAKAKIVVTDDDPEIRDTMRELLETRGYTVVTAADRDGRMEAIRRERPDLAIVDVMMATWQDGFEMSRELKLSAITIKRAYFDLEKDGYIVTRAGLGSFVADINKEKIRGEKMAEIRKDVSRLIKTGSQFDISVDEIIALIREEAQNRD